MREVRDYSKLRGYLLRMGQVVATAYLFVCVFAGSPSLAVDQAVEAPRVPTIAEAPRAPLVFTFKIDAIALTKALDQYSTTTGIHLICDSYLLDGKLASPVYGRMTPETALSLMLHGTNLFAVFGQPGAAMIFPDPIGARTAPVPDGKFSNLGSITVETRRMPFSASFYSELIQARVQSALSKHANDIGIIRRARLRLWIDDNGRISRATLVDSKPDSSSETHFLDIVQGVIVGLPPPRDFVQPVSIRVSVSGTLRAEK